MASLKQFELQHQIKENSQGIAETINELHKWEKNIKRSSAANCQTKKNENEYPIRSHKQNSTVITNGHPKLPETQTVEPNHQNGVASTSPMDANSYKDLGNKSVKSSDFETAIQHYTKAIEMKEDPVFYSNRAFCFLKLERYTDCIDDCTKAVQLDPKLVKGFYRRMQANEVLENFDLALKDCKEVIKLDPNNADAKRANQRLSQRIAGKNLSQLPSNTNFLSWSKLDASVKDVSFIQKPPHLRSKKPLRRILINEPLPTNSCTPPDKKSKDEENAAFKIVAEQMSNVSVEKVAAAVPTEPPNSSAQFYRAWRELADDRQKYSYLKIIEPTAFNKLLGLLDSEMLKDLLKILSENFVRDNLPVSGILKHIIVHNEFIILKMLMDTEDRNAFEKLLKYIESNEPNAADLTFIKDKYFD